MDITEFLKNKGTIEVPNPNYNPRSKKNKGTPTIKVPQLQPTNSDGVNMAIVDFNNQYSIDKKEADKYSKYGLNYSPYEDMNLQLAEAQSAWKKWGNSLAQTLVSEIGLGTIKAGSDLIDFIGKAVGLADGDYTNPVSKFLEEKQEEFKEFAPIYSDPSKNIFNGGLLDAGWWTSNMPSIASSLTLLVPAMGVTNLAKATKIGKLVSFGRRHLKPVEKAVEKAKLAQTMREAGASADAIADATKLTFWQKALTNPKIINATNKAAEITTTAALSRTMENYQEARQTYNDVYLQASEALRNMSDEDYQKVLNKNSSIFKELGTDINNRDEVAKAIAKKSADETFRIDFLNMGWDVLQLYALRGMFKGKGVSPGTAASVRRANIDSTRFPNKTAQEIAALKAKRSFGEKAKEFISDRLYASKLIVGAELSEGAEEALNYIAQQEGIHLGQVMTDQIEDTHNTDFWENVFSGFDGRLQDYVKAPALWDSAFWGVLGGVVFQGLGSKFRQLSDKLTNKDDLTEEERKNLPWYKFDELPENKARITNIQSWGITFNKNQALLEQINKGIDPYSSTANNQVTLTPAEQEVARKKLQNETAQSMMLDAMQVGNGDMLKAYWANDNIRKAMVENGFFNDTSNPNKTEEEKETESKEYVKEVLEELNKVEEMYNQELVAVSDIVGMINVKSKINDQLPAEYIQIIANKNVTNELAGELVDRTINGINTSINEIKTDLNNKNQLDPNIDYENNVRLEVYANQLGKLRAQRRKLVNEKDNSLTNRIAINNIDKQIEYIENVIRPIYSQAAFAYATHRSLQYIIDDDGNYKTMNTPEAFEYYDNMITRRAERANGELFNLEEVIPGNKVLPSRVLSDAEVGEFDTLKSDINSSFETLKNVSPRLENLYYRKVEAELQRANLRNSLNRSIDDIQEYATMLHNTMNEARKKAINNAYKIIRDLYKNKKEDVLDALEIIENNQSLDNIKNLTEDEKFKLKDAIDILAITKQRNSRLLDTIYQTLELQDRIEEANQQNNPHNNSNTTPVNPPITPSQDNQNNVPSNPPQPTPQSAPTPSQPPQSPQNGQSNTPSSQPQNAPTQAPTQPQGQSQSQIDPQNLANHPNPIQIDSLNFGGIKYNSPFVIFDNEDGTFTLNTDANIGYYKNFKFYDNAADIDLLSGTPITTVYPIIKRKDDGSYEVVSKGHVEIVAQQPNSQPTNNQQVNPDTNNPSTGEVDNRDNVVQQNPNDTTDALSNINLNDLDELNRKTSQTLLPIFKANITNNPNPDYDSILELIDIEASKLVNDAIINGIDEAEAIRTVTKVKNLLTRKLTNLKNKNNQTLASSVDDLLINQSSLREAKDKNTESLAIKAYRESMYNMLNQYVAEQGLQSFNGVNYIHLEDLLRYVNQVTNDSDMAQNIFESLKRQLLTDETRKKFVVIDENEVNRNNFLDDVAKTAEQRMKERTEDIFVQDININGILREAENNEEENKIYQALESLRPGDKLSYKVDESKKVINITDEKGNIVGNLPVPSINTKTGAYEMSNDDWIYSIIPTNNNSINSPLYDLFLNWFNPKTDEARELLSLIYEASFNKLSNERKESILKEFANNAEIKKAKKLGFTIDNADDRKLFNGLVKLARFFKDTSGGQIFNKTDDIIRRVSLNKWFNKLSNSYDLTLNMYKNPNNNVNIQVKSVATGDIIRVQEVVDKNKIDEFPIPNKAIAGGVNTDINKIAITDPIHINRLLVSGLENQSFNATAGNTFVLIPDGLGTYQFVQAWPVKANDKLLGDKAKEIVSVIKEETHRLFEEYNKNSTDANRNNIENFFNKLVFNFNGNSTLFRGVSIKPLKRKNGFNINANGTNNVIIVYNRVQSNENGVVVGIGNMQNVGINSKEFKDKLDAILDSLQFQFSYSYFQSDNNTNLHLNGIATRENGKFVINVGEKRWEFDSFNDFVLNQNLVRLNTKPNESGTSNFNKGYTRNTNIQQSFKVDITRPTTSPVEERIDVQPQQPSSPIVNVRDRVLNVINSNINHKGNAIFEAIIGTDELFNESTLKALQKLNLLPKNIIFDAEFNNRRGFETYNAAYNPKTKQVIVGEKWMEMMSNPNSRREAIRKLMHEQLHHLLNRKDKKAILNNIEGIFKEFENALNDEKSIAKLKEVGLDIEHLKQYLFEGNQNALEEFIVESLTSEELATALNNIEAKDYKKGRIANLFQKILDFLSKLFNWGVKEGSLYEKELYTIRTTFSKQNNVTETEVQAEEEIVQPQQEEIVEQPQVEVEKPTIVEQPQEEKKPKQFGEGERRSRNRERSKFSSITEKDVTNNINSNIASNLPSVKSFTERLPVNQQAKFASLVARGEVSTSCK